jgi:hypothetical protein
VDKALARGGVSNSGKGVGSRGDKKRTDRLLAGRRRLAVKLEVTRLTPLPVPSRPLTPTPDRPAGPSRASISTYFTPFLRSDSFLTVATPPIGFLSPAQLRLISSFIWALIELRSTEKNGGPEGPGFAFRCNSPGLIGRRSTAVPIRWYQSAGEGGGRMMVASSAVYKWAPRTRASPVRSKRARARSSYRILETEDRVLAQFHFREALGTKEPSAPAFKLVGARALWAPIAALDFIFGKA